jgi:hypothetical protein
MRGKLILMLSLVLTAQLAKAQNSSEIGERTGLQNDLNNFVQGEGTRVFTGGTVPTFNVKGETVGNRYLFDHWVPGMVTNSHDSVLNYPSVLYNYDKITQSLLMFQDRKVVIEVYPEQIKSFTLKGTNRDYVFQHIPMIGDDYLQPLIMSKKYSLYKSVKTRFVKADYSTNGISESGSNYDEFKDMETYYVILPGGREFAKLEPKKKAIKQALPKETAKIEAYFYANNPEFVDEPFMVGLINELNK